MRLNEQKCPKCGSADVVSEFTIKTNNPWPHMLVNGIPNPPDPNKWIYSSRCRACGKEWFSVTDGGGNMKETVDR